MNIIRDEFLDAAELAAQLGLKPRTLSAWSSRRRGPPRTRIAGKVLYRTEAVRAWLAQQERDPGNRRS